MGLASVSSLVAGASDPPEEVPRFAGRLVGDHILVPLLTPEVPAVTDQLRVAAALARTTDASLNIVNPVRVPDQTSAEHREEVAADTERALLEWAVEQVSASTSTVDARFLYNRRVIDGILENVEAEQIDTIVAPSEPGRGFRRSLTTRLASHTDADIITVNGRGGFEPVPSILLAVAGGPHSGLAIDVAQRIAADCDAWIDVLHVVEEDASAGQRKRADETAEAAFKRVGRPESTTKWVLEAEDAVDAIIEQSSYYGLTIIGAPTKGRLRQFIFGSTNQTIRKKAKSVILSVRNNQ